MSRKEIHRGHVLELVIHKTISLREAATLMGLSYRQTKRVFSRYKHFGLEGIVHRNRGRPPSNRLSPELVEEILRLNEDTYCNFNDVHFTEKLAEKEGIIIGRETVRKLLRSHKRPAKRKRRPPKHRSRRPREQQFGAMLQWDGSPHPWFGLNHPECSLLAAVDDAEGDILGARFEPQETAAGYLRLLDGILDEYGLPLAIYHDRHSIFVRNDDYWSLDEQLRGKRYPTHVGRVLEELGIRSIAARSPQAKGRVERLFATLQDRLCAELSLQGITDMDQANAWLKETFIPAYNIQFGHKSAKRSNAFRPISARDRFHMVSFAYEATVGNDNCVRLGGLTIDIPPGKNRKSYAKASVLVRQHVDGSWTVWHNHQRVAGQGPTPFAEPLRSWKTRAKGAKDLIQLYTIHPKPTFPETLEPCTPMR